MAQTVATQIGNYAQRQKEAAEAAGDQATADKWKEGGEYRIAMHIAGGAAVAGLGGGSVAGGAAGAGVSAALAGNLNDLSNAITRASPTGNADADRALGNIIANALAAGAGAVVGGSSGASIGSAVDMYNAEAHCSNQKCEGSTPGSISAGIRNGIVSIAEMAVNLPNGGPFASPSDPGYISLDGLRVPYSPGDAVGPDVEFWTAVLATRGSKGTAAEARALTEAEAFERSLVNLPPGERVAQVKQTAQTVAADNGWAKDSQLSRLNGRDVYRADDGTLYAVDSQHGRFEQVNGKTGAHMGEVSMLDLKTTKPADTSGQHDLRLK